MSPRTTLVLGASPDKTRYGYLAAVRLQANGHPVVLVGKREGTVGDVPILPQVPVNVDVDTVTLYLAPANQTALIPAILGLHPRRIIFNPGTENPTLMALAEAQGVEVVEGCTLVMLSIGQY